MQRLSKSDLPSTNLDLFDKKTGARLLPVSTFLGKAVKDMTEQVCPKCQGSGALELERTHYGVPITSPCSCLLVKDIVRNLNRGWAGLSSASKLDSSPLLEHTWDDLYITCTDEVLRSHLRHVGIRMGWTWGFKVVTDVDLMTAWLSPASLLGKEILDPEAASVSAEKATLVDLIDPPDLLIVRVGVKAARNGATSEVFLETLLYRNHVKKPIWVVDQPTKRLDAGHMCFSTEVVGVMSSWPHLMLSPQPGQLQESKVVNQESPAIGNITLGGVPQLTGTTRRVELPAPKEPKSKKFIRGDR